MIVLLILAIVFVSLFVYTTGSFIAYPIVDRRPRDHYFLCTTRLSSKRVNYSQRCNKKVECAAKHKNISIWMAVFWLPLIVELGSRKLGEYLVLRASLGPQFIAKKIVGGLDLGPKQSYEELQSRNKELEKELGMKI